MYNCLRTCLVGMKIWKSPMYRCNQNFSYFPAIDGGGAETIYTLPHFPTSHTPNTPTTRTSTPPLSTLPQPLSHSTPDTGTKIKQKQMTLRHSVSQPLKGTMLGCTPEKNLVGCTPSPRSKEICLVCDPEAKCTGWWSVPISGKEKKYWFIV